MVSTPTEWLTLDAAATRLGVSTRTLQRRVTAGDIRSQRREDGRTLVEVDATPCPTPVAAPAIVERLQQQADDTNRVAALAALASEQTALAFRDRLATVEQALSDARSTARSWRVACAVAASVTLSAVVAAGYLAGNGAATGRQLSDMSGRLDAAERLRDGLQADLRAVTEARHLSDTEVVRLREQVEALQMIGAAVTDTCRADLAVVSSHP
jgi:hypothetical protein